MSLAEELATKVYSSMPAAMPCNSVFAIALVNAALERAALECEKQAGTCDLYVVNLVDGEDWETAARIARQCAERIRALKSSRG